MSDPDVGRSPDSEVGSVVESFLARFRKGERPALTDLIAGHPDLAEQLREVIPALVELERIGNPSGPTSRPRADATAEPGASRPSSLGDYKILRYIGSGGMGVVYEAERESLRSRVALKVMHPRYRADEKYLRRFRVEAQSAAGLHHSNIVSVFDYGSQDGICYYAMQFIQGQPLDLVLGELRNLRALGRDADAAETLGVAGPPAHRDPRSIGHGLRTGRFASSRSGAVAFEDANPIATTLVGDRQMTEDAGLDADADNPRTPGEPSSFGSSSLGGGAEGRYYREVARICAQVADALDHAHRAGVLHRDIKPSNLLLDASGDIWVTDFGLAKREDSEGFSRSQELVGTLRYMAPERFRGISGRGGDIYALGATLYELATLRPAFDGSDHVRLIDRIVHEAPERPRLVDRHVPRDLETIILKALAKDPKDRFGSAREMAEELRKFEGGHPIRSRPISSAERCYRWCRRNPWLAAANISAASAMLALGVGSTIAAKVYHDGQQQYAAVAADAREKLFDSLVSQARASRFSRQVGQRFESLAALTNAVKIGRELRLPPERFDNLRDEVIASLMLPDMKPVGRPIEVPTESLNCIFDEGMTRYAIRHIDGSIVVRGWDDDHLIARVAAFGDRHTPTMHFSPDGTYLASLDGPALSVWDVNRESHVWTVPSVRRSDVASFSPDSSRIAVTPDTGTVLIHDLRTGQSRSWTVPGEVRSLVFRPGDGKEIAVACAGDPTVCRILDAETGRQLLITSIPGIVDYGATAWSLDGSTLAVATLDKKVALLHAKRFEQGASIAFSVTPNSGLAVAFHPAGTLLASNSWEGRLRLWDPSSGRLRLSMSGGGIPRFSKDGRILVIRGEELMAWRVDPALEYRTLAYPSDRPQHYARPSIHRDGRILAVGTLRGVILWDLARRVELGLLPIGTAAYSMFEPSGDLITNGEAGLLRWPVRHGPKDGEVQFGPPQLITDRGTNFGIAVDGSGRAVAMASQRSVQVAIGDRTIPIVPLDDCRGVSLSPDARWLATNDHSYKFTTIWSLPEGIRVDRYPGQTGMFSVFSPDGKYFVSGSNPCRIVTVGSWREIQRFEGNFLCFSPDSRLVVVSDKSNILWMVEVATGRVIARFEGPDDHNRNWVEFSPDGSRLVWVSNDPASVQVIDLRLIRQGLASMGLDWAAPAFPQEDPARPDLPPLHPVQIDFGFLTSHIEDFSEDSERQITRYTEKIQKNPDDSDALHHRAHALAKRSRIGEALIDVSRAISLLPRNVHLLQLRAQFQAFRKPEVAIADLEFVLKLDPSLASAREFLAEVCNRLAWNLAAKPASRPATDRALVLSLRALELQSKNPIYLNTRGVILYRDGQLAEAVTYLEKSLANRQGQTDGSDLIFLAMAHHRLGHREEARRCLDRAVPRQDRQSLLTDMYPEELKAFWAEAKAVLSSPPGQSPDDVSGRSEVKDRPAP